MSAIQPSIIRLGLETSLHLFRVRGPLFTLEQIIYDQIIYDIIQSRGGVVVSC